MTTKHIKGWTLETLCIHYDYRWVNFPVPGKDDRFTITNPHGIQLVRGTLAECLGWFGLQGRIPTGDISIIVGRKSTGEPTFLNVHGSFCDFCYKQGGYPITFGSKIDAQKFINLNRSDLLEDNPNIRDIKPALRQPVDSTKPFDALVAATETEERPPND